MVESYEEQLAQSSTYQRAQRVTAEELIAGKFRLLEEQADLEEKLEGLLLKVDLKDKKLEHEILVKDETIDRLGHGISLKDGRLLSWKRNPKEKDLPGTNSSANEYPNSNPKESRLQSILRRGSSATILQSHRNSTPSSLQ